MKTFLTNLLVSTILLSSCGESPKPNNSFSEKKSSSIKADKSLPVQIPKSKVSSIAEIEWQSVAPIKIHHGYSRMTDYEKQNLSKKLKIFSILNNGAISAEIDRVKYFSKDHGSNWHIPFFEDGHSLHDSLGNFRIYHTADFFVAETALNQFPSAHRGNNTYRHYISKNGFHWEEASKHNFVFDDYVKSHRGSLLYKAENIETFKRVRSGRPNDFHAIVYNMKEMTATIFPYKDEEYKIPKHLEYNTWKHIYQLCNGEYLVTRPYVNYYERGKSLNALKKIVYDDNTTGSTFSEFGQTVKTRRSQGLKILSNNENSPSKFEVLIGGLYHQMGNTC